jgi:hypothetical protein
VRRWLLIGGGIAVAVLLFLILLPDDETPSLPRRITAPTQPTTETSGPTRTAPAPRPQRITVRIAVRDSRVVGGPRVHSVRKGRRVTLVVTSNVADHVHLHGYDLMRDVAPGRPARIAFRARLAGRFEIELEDRRLPLGELEVRP